MKNKMISILLIFVLFLFACTPGADKLPTPTATVPPTPQPTATFTPTNTPPPTNTPLPPTPTINPEPIKIGLLGPLSWPIPMFSTSTIEGASMVIDEWNAKGGVLGRKVELVTADSECKLDKALDAFYRLVNDEGVRYIIGDYCSPTAAQLSRLAADKGVILITPGATSPVVTVDDKGSVWPNTFRTCVTDTYEGAMMAKYAYERGYRSAFLMYDAKDTYLLNLATGFEDKFSALGGKIAGSVIYSGGASSFTTEINKIKQSQADVIFIPGYTRDVNKIAKQVKQAGVKAILLGSDAWDQPDLDLTVMEGNFFFSHHVPFNPSTSIQQWNNRYGERYKDDQGKPKVPDMIAALTYDATNMLLEAIRQSGVDDPSGVRSTLEAGTWKLVTGVIHFDEFHDPIKPATILSVQKGEVIFADIVEP